MLTFKAMNYISSSSVRFKNQPLRKFEFIFPYSIALTYENQRILYLSGQFEKKYILAISFVRDLKMFSILRFLF